MNAAKQALLERADMVGRGIAQQGLPVWPISIPGAITSPQRVFSA